MKPLWRGPVLFAAVAVLLPGRSPAIEPTESQSKPYLQAVAACAERTLSHCRDRYGKLTTPLFVDGLHAASLEPARWKHGGQTWVLSNFASPTINSAATTPCRWPRCTRPRR